MPESLAKALRPARSLVRCIVLIAAALLLANVGRSADGDGDDVRPDNPMRTVYDLTGRRLGVLTGTNHDQAADAALDYTQFEYFEDVKSMFRALRSGEVDALLCDSPVARYYEKSDPTLRRLKGVFRIDHFAFAMRRDDNELFDRINGAVRELLADGTVDRLTEEWMDGPIGDWALPAQSVEPGAKVIRLGVGAAAPPLAFRDNKGNIIGFEVELAMLVAEKLGYRLEVADIDYGQLISSLFYGRIDMAGSGLGIDGERGLLARFTDSYFTSGVTALVLAD